MENASKALLIAGAVLICIVLISVGMMIISSSTEVTDQVDDLTSTQAAQTFNNQFSKYAGTQKGSSVKTLLETIATSNNTATSGSGKLVSVTFATGNLTSDNNSSNIVSAMSSVVNSKKYKVDITSQDSEGYISAITITLQTT